MKQPRPIRLGDELERVSDSAQVAADESYQEIGIRSHGKGIFHKKPTTGAALGDKRVFWVKPGCFILNIIFAWEQAVAVTTTREAGFIASHRFPMWRSRGGINLRYLLHFFKTEQGRRLLSIASPGGAGRNKTLNQVDFEDILLALPPLDQQEQIARALDSWERATGLLEAAINARRVRKTALIRHLLENGGTRDQRLGDLAQINPPAIRVEPELQVSFVQMEDVSEHGRLIRHRPHARSELGSGYTAFREGDILVAKITPCFENGKGAHTTDLYNGVGYGSTEFHVVRPNDPKDGRFILHHVSASSFRRNGERYMSGSAGQRRVPAEFIEDYRIARLTAAQRQDAARVLDNCDAETDALVEQQGKLLKQRAGLARRLFAAVAPRRWNGG